MLAVQLNQLLRQLKCAVLGGRPRRRGDLQKGPLDGKKSPGECLSMEKGWKRARWRAVERLSEGLPHTSTW